MAILSLAGVDLYYHVAGHGLPVVLVHGLALDARMWDDQVGPLASVATVIRYDVRGFGRSTPRDGDLRYTHAADLFALLDHLSFDTAVLVGLSMGGRIVTEAALQAPERVKALVLLDAVLDGVPWDDRSAQGMQSIADGLRERGLSGAKSAWLSHDFFVPAHRRPSVAGRLARMVDDYSGMHWTEHDPHGPQPDCRPLLDRIAAPTTVVVGALDVLCFREMADVLAAEVPRARKIVIPDAGHMVNMEAPDVVTEILREVVAAA
jgi:3-oxoadipate enol-lactonase